MSVEIIEAFRSLGTTDDFGRIRCATPKRGMSRHTTDCDGP